MSELHPLFGGGDVVEQHVVGVHEDGLVTYNKLFVPQLLIPHHVDVGVRYVQLVLPLHEEVVVGRIVFSEPDQKEAQFALELVAEHEEAAVLVIVDDLLDVADFVQLVQVYERLRAVVVVDAILHRGYNGHILVVVEHEVLGLSGKRFSEFDDGLKLLSVPVELNYGVLLSENKLLRFLGTIFSWVLKVELHADVVELLSSVLDDDSFDELKPVSFVDHVQIDDSLEDKELVRELLVLNKVFARDNGDEMLAGGGHHTNDFTGLPSLALHQWYLDSALGQLLVTVDVEELYRVQFRDGEGIHRLERHTS